MVAGISRVESAQIVQWVSCRHFQRRAPTLRGRDRLRSSGMVPRTPSRHSGKVDFSAVVAVKMAKECDEIAVSHAEIELAHCRGEFVQI